MDRLNDSVLRLDDRIGKEGNYYYSARYFPKTCNIIKKHMPDAICLLQVFQKRDNTVIVGTDLYIEAIRKFAECYLDKIKVWSVNDGYIAKALEPIMQIEAPYWAIGFLESVSLGHLKRSSGVATNARDCHLAANGKPIMFMADRNDDYHTQSIDGYACYKSGINTFATNAMCAYWDGLGTGTIPHSLIAHFNGDIIKTCKAYLEEYPNDKLIALVDFNNDVIDDSLDLLDALGDKIYGVRVDTSKALVDRTVFQWFHGNNIMELGKFDPRGVCIPLVKHLRESLDFYGYNSTKIVVSGGFNAKKIKEFEDNNVPVDIYGVGSSLLDISGFDFTQDVVKINDKHCAKVGRGYVENNNLKLHEW